MIYDGEVIWEKKGAMTMMMLNDNVGFVVVVVAVGRMIKKRLMMRRSGIRVFERDRPINPRKASCHLHDEQAWLYSGHVINGL